MPEPRTTEQLLADWRALLDIFRTDQPEVEDLAVCPPMRVGELRALVDDIADTKRREGQYEEAFTMQREYRFKAEREVEALSERADMVDPLERRLSAARDGVARLRRALGRHGVHDAACTWYASHGGCDCGLFAALGHRPRPLARRGAANGQACQFGLRQLAECVCA